MVVGLQVVAINWVLMVLGSHHCLLREPFPIVHQVVLRCGFCKWIMMLFYQCNRWLCQEQSYGLWSHDLVKLLPMCNHIDLELYSFQSCDLLKGKFMSFKMEGCFDDILQTITIRIRPKGYTIFYKHSNTIARLQEQLPNLMQCFSLIDKQTICLYILVSVGQLNEVGIQTSFLPRGWLIHYGNVLLPRVSNLHTLYPLYVP